MCTIREKEIFDSPFQKLIGRSFNVEQNVSASEHFVNILNTGEDALLARIHLICAAQKSICIQTYIWKNDDIGKLFISELIASAKRGVRVRLLIDPWASYKDPQWVAFLSTLHSNLELKYYNPSAKEIHPSTLDIIRELTWNFKQVNQRMHNKLFMVDEKVGITGGRNYGNDYYDRGSENNFKDRDVLVIGPVVKEMMNSFEEFWTYKLSIKGKDLLDVRKHLKKINFSKLNSIQNFSFESQFDDLWKLVLDAKYIRSHYIEPSFSVKKVRFVADLPGKNQSSTFEGGGVVCEEFLKFKRNAKKLIIAQSPYLVLDKKSKRNIKEIKKRYPKIEIIISTNSLASTDNIYTYSYAFKHRKMYVKKMNFQIFELKPRPGDYEKMIGYQKTRKGNLCIHAKTFITDDSSVWIGSFNFDARSLNLNTETALIIEDKKVVNVVKNNILVDISAQNSWAVGRQEKMPMISYFSGFMCKIIKYIPAKFKWPFCYTSNYELKKGKKAVPFYHEKFHDHYTSVGPYPNSNYTIKEIEVILLKALIEFARPIL